MLRSSKNCKAKMALPTLINFVIILIFGSTILPLMALLSFLIYIPAYLFSCFFKSYGKFLSYLDVWVDEDLNNIPRPSLTTTLTLEGDLTLTELMTIFKTNVLEAKCKENPRKLRYPELQQFVTTFICFRIWKSDPHFLIENHIKEKSFDNMLTGENLLKYVHQKYLNKPFKSDKSPWEMVLIRNVKLNSDVENINADGEQPSLLVFRVHHVMADVKSVLKLLVECLGRKQLKTANPEIIVKDTTWNKIKFLLSFPIKFVITKNNFWRLIHQSYHHPWKNQTNFGKRNDPNLKMEVFFSSEIRLRDLKMVAMKKNVKTSAVVLSIISGAVKNICGDMWDKEVAIIYPLPKPNHPEFLTNHMYMAVLRLPTNQICGQKILQMCNEEFVEVKASQQSKYLNVNAILNGNQIYPISRYVTNMPAPIGVTNNAGEEEGFCVGNAECIDFRMSVGIFHGFMGVLFSTMSYKGKLRISVTADNSILEKDTVEKLVKQLELEWLLILNSH